MNDFFDYLRQAVSLADDHPELEKEIYSRQTLSLVRSVLPAEWDREFIKSVGGLNPGYRMSFKKLMNFAEEKKTEIHFSRKTRIEVKEDQEKNKGEPSKSRSNVTNRANFQGNKHICRDSKDCRTEWDILGCVEFFRLAKIKERKIFCRENYFCQKCGEKFPD